MISTVNERLSDPEDGVAAGLDVVEKAGSHGRCGRTDRAREDHDIERQDFVVTTSNKPLHFLQHIMTILDINGRAAVIVEDLTAALAGFEAVDAALDGSSAGSWSSDSSRPFPPSSRLHQLALQGPQVYQQWVAGFDLETMTPKGHIRTDDNALRFVEVVVNGPKTWSLAAALHPEVSAALDRAQDKAAIEIVGWVAAHATTRVGPRGRQVQVLVESIEAAVIRHYTSRAGDPHRHLHLQINARVWASGLSQRSIQRWPSRLGPVLAGPEGDAPGARVIKAGPAETPDRRNTRLESCRLKTHYPRASGLIPGRRC